MGIFLRELNLGLSPHYWPEISNASKEEMSIFPPWALCVGDVAQLLPRPRYSLNKGELGAACLLREGACLWAARVSRKRRERSTTYEGYLASSRVLVLRN